MANNSTRDILQRMSDHLEDLEGLDYEKTQPLPDDVTDLNTFLTPGIYRVEHPEDVAHGPFSEKSTTVFYHHPYILIIKSKLDAAPSWCQQYALLLGETYYRSYYDNNNVLTAFANVPWTRMLDETNAASYMTYGNGIGGMQGSETSINIRGPFMSYCPMFVSAYTEDGNHFALFAVVVNPLGQGTSKWIINTIVSDDGLSLTAKDGDYITLTRSGSLLSYSRVFYTTIRSVKY